MPFDPTGLFPYLMKKSENLWFSGVLRGAGQMESYGEWRVTVYDAIFGELRFLDSHTT